MKIGISLFLGVLGLMIATNAFALSQSELDTKIKSSLSRCQTEVKGCRELTEKAAGVLVFPEVTKGGLGVAYETGTGALLEGNKIVRYYKTSTTSLGATIGMGSKSQLVVFKTAEALEKFKKSSGWEVGADAGVAMLDTGKTGQVDTNNIKEAIVGIVFGESGALADVSIKGSKISLVDPKELS